MLQIQTQDEVKCSIILSFVGNEVNKKLKGNKI